MLTAVTSSSPLEGPAVERLDVLQFVAELQVAGVDLVVGQGVEHEGVVGIGAVADGDQLLAHVSYPDVMPGEWEDRAWAPVGENTTAGPELR